MLLKDKAQGAAAHSPAIDHDSTLATSSTAFILDDMSSEDEEEQEIPKQDNNNMAIDTEEAAFLQGEAARSPSSSTLRSMLADEAASTNASGQDGSRETSANGAHPVGSPDGQASELQTTCVDADALAHPFPAHSPPAPPVKQTESELTFQASEEATASPTITAQSQMDDRLDSAVEQGGTTDEVDMTVCFERLEGEAGSPCPDIRPSTPPQQVLPSQQPIAESARPAAPVVRPANQPEIIVADSALEASDPAVSQQEQTDRSEPQRHACEPSPSRPVHPCASVSPTVRDAAPSPAVAHSAVVHRALTRQDGVLDSSTEDILLALDSPVAAAASTAANGPSTAVSHLDNDVFVGLDDGAVPAGRHTVVQPATSVTSPRSYQDLRDEVAGPTSALLSSSTGEAQTGLLVAGEGHETAEASSEPYSPLAVPGESDQSVELGRCQPASADDSPTPSCIDALQPLTGATDMASPASGGMQEPASLELISPVAIPNETPSPASPAQQSSTAARCTPGPVRNVQDAPLVKRRILARSQASPRHRVEGSETSHALASVQQSAVIRTLGSPTLRTENAPLPPTRRSARTLARVASTESIASQEGARGVKRSRTNCTAVGDDKSAQLTPPLYYGSPEVPAKRHNKRVAVIADLPDPEATRRDPVPDVGRARTRAARSGIPTAAVPNGTKPRAQTTRKARAVGLAASHNAVRQDAKGKGREQRQASHHADEGVSSDESEAAILVPQTSRSPQRSGPVPRASRSARPGAGIRKATRQAPVAQSSIKLATSAPADALAADSASASTASSAKVQLRSPQRIPLPSSPKKRNERSHASAGSPLRSNSSGMGPVSLWPNIAHMSKSVSNIRGPMSPDGSKRVS